MYFESDVFLHAEESTSPTKGLSLLLLLFGREVLEDNAELFVVLLEDALSYLEVLVVIGSLSLVLGSERHELILE